MSEFDQDKDYQALHKKYHQDATELPPQSLDAEILQAAHLSVAKSSLGMDTQPVKRAWFIPVSYVAILVISLSVVMKLALEPEMSEVELDMPATEFLPERQADKEILDNEPVKSESDVASRRALSLPAAPATTTNIREQKRLQQVDKQVQLAKKPAKAKQRLKQHPVQQPLPSEENVRSLAPAVTGAESVQVSGISAMTDSAIDNEALERGNDLKASQQLHIDKLVKLYENGQFEKLKVSLLEYRKNYPAGDMEELLPEQLLAWEDKNITEALSSD